MNSQTPLGNALSPELPFLKMHGLGNDFVIFDARARPLLFSDETIRRIADRRTGVGCDQVIILEHPRSDAADIFMRIRNADGGDIAACGNASRCVAWLLAGECGRATVTIETVAGLVRAETLSSESVTVDMGVAGLAWQDIPLVEAADTLHLQLALGQLSDPVAVSMGNPHAVFFVDAVDSVDLAQLGPVLEHDRLFPERANIEIAQIIDEGRIRMRVWERGTGITPACGSGACAVLVAAARRGLTGRAAEVELDGGTLSIAWQADGHVLMTGPIALSYSGMLDASRLS